MKKIALFAAMLALVFASCEKKPDVVVVNSITLDKTELKLNVGATEMLKATTDPKGQEVIWSSNNEKVAKVNSAGSVEGIDEGEAVITAKSGDKTATCKVTVSKSQIYSLFNVADYGIFGEPELIPGTDTIIVGSVSGTEYKCQLGKSTIYAWDGSLNFINGTGWAGEGLFIEIPDILLYWVMEGGKPTAYIGMGGFSVGGDGKSPYQAQPAKMDLESYGAWINLLYNEKEIEGLSEAEITEKLNTLADEVMAKNSGAFYTVVDANNDDFSNVNFFIHYGFIDKMIVLDNEDEEEGGVIWGADVRWADITSENKLFGFTFDLDQYNETENIELIKPYADNFSVIPAHHDDYEILSAKVAQKDFVVKKPYSAKDIPAFASKNRKMDLRTLHMAR